MAHVAVSDAQTSLQVMRAVTEELMSRGSSLVDGDCLDAAIAEHIEGIVSEVLLAVTVSPEATGVNHEAPAGPSYEDSFRLADGCDPAEYLLATEVIFGVALPILIRSLSPRRAEKDAIAIARALHHTISRRFHPGVVAYVEEMIENLHLANQESRKQISRELHDRVAHGIAAGVQRVELSRLRTSRRQSDRDLESALSILRESLVDAQDIAGTLRQLVQDRPLEDVVANYLSRFGSLSAETTSIGAPFPLPSAVAEETYAIVTEAIRNADRHSFGTFVKITFAWGSDSLTISINDDGVGFDPAHARPEGLGLAGMRERARSLGATLSIDSSAKGRTCITLLLPMPETQDATGGAHR